MAHDTRETTVYRLYCGHGLLLYVGVAVDVKRRLSQHAKTKTWWPDVQVAITDVYATRLQALKVEAYYITYYRPKHNVSGQTKLLALPYPQVSGSFYVSDRGEMLPEHEARAKAARLAGGPR